MREARGEISNGEIHLSKFLFYSDFQTVTSHWPLTAEFRRPEKDRGPFPAEGLPRTGESQRSIILTGTVAKVKL